MVASVTNNVYRLNIKFGLPGGNKQVSFVSLPSSTGDFSEKMNDDEDYEDFFKEFNFSPQRALFQKPEDKPDTPEDDEEKALLEPDHPLLKKFQLALKEHLLKQIERFKEDVEELETGIKVNGALKEQVGIEAYERQQIVSNQDTEIDNYIRDIDEMEFAKTTLEAEIETINEEYKAAKNSLLEEEKKEIELRKEMDSLNLLLHQMSNWEKDLESSLTINQRITEKTRKDKLRLSQEKKEQDMLVYKLMSEVWRLEGELETMLMEMRVREEEREKLAERVSLSNVDIEANESEQKCLVHGWQSVIITITKRDKQYTNLLTEYNQRHEELLSLNSEIVQIKKLCNKELLLNESLTLFKERINKDIKATNKLLELESAKRTKFDKTMANYDKVLERLDINIYKNASIISELESQMKAILFQIDKKTLEKNEVEEEMFALLQGSNTNNRAAAHMKKITKKIKEENRHLGILIARIENNIGRAMKDTSTQIWENTEMTEAIKEIKKQVDEEEAALDASIKEMDRCELEQERKMRIYEILKIRHEKFMDVALRTTLTPQESKIKSLENAIADIMDKNKTMQTYWLREQSIVVDLSEKRQIQIKETNTLKKQSLVLDQKNSKLNEDLEQYKAKEEAIERSIKYLQNKMASYTEALNKTKGTKDYIDAVNHTTEQELSMKLEEAEMESLKLKQELTEIEEDKEFLAMELLEKNRDALTWEKKIQMINEAKKTMMAEKGEEGDIGRMKAEIHRMNVRYIQLKKVQEKLMKDLEHCVGRRDKIVNMADNKIRMGKNASNHMKVHFAKKMSDLKNKLQKYESEMTRLDLKTSVVNEHIESQTANIENCYEKIRELDKETRELIQRMDKIAMEKKLNLEILVCKQRKLKVYAELARGRTPYTIYKTVSAANAAYDKEKETNNKLLIIVENLMSDFPGHACTLEDIQTTLQLPALYI